MTLRNMNEIGHFILKIKHDSMRKMYNEVTLHVTILLSIADEDLVIYAF